MDGGKKKKRKTQARGSPWFRRGDYFESNDFCLFIVKWTWLARNSQETDTIRSARVCVSEKIDSDTASRIHISFSNWFPPLLAEVSSFLLFFVAIWSSIDREFVEYSKARNRAESWNKIVFYFLNYIFEIRCLIVSKYGLYSLVRGRIGANLIIRVRK